MDHIKMGNTIRRLCGLHEVTQAELAKAVGVSPQTMTNLVRGITEARMSTYFKVFAYFEIDPTDDWRQAAFSSLDHADEIASKK